MFIYLVFIIEQFGQLRDGTSGQLSIILIVNEVDNCMLQHLRGLSQTLHCGWVSSIQLGWWDLDTLLQGLGEHSSSDTLGPSHGITFNV